MEVRNGTEYNNLFSTGAVILENNHIETRYQIKCDTPDGTMRNYHLFPGVDLSYTTFHANSCFRRQHSLPHILEIAYCHAGRYECEYRRGFMTYLGEGDFAVSVITSHREEPIFPTGFYDGIAIIIDMEVTGNFFSGGVEGININFAKLARKFCTDRCCAVMKSPPELQHVFQELCALKGNEDLGYLRLKVLEIFYHISNMLPQDTIEVSAYFSGETIKKAKAVKAEIMSNLDTKISLRELADKYGLSLTMLKDCFKAIYGKPIHAFQREYKMQVASKLLKTTGLSISEIAGNLGYENPNKFSSAFKEIIGMSPREYRGAK